MQASVMALLDEVNPRHLEVPNSVAQSPHALADGKHKVAATQSGYTVHATVKAGQPTTYLIEDGQGKAVDGVVFQRGVSPTGGGGGPQAKIWLCWEDEGRKQSVCVRVG